MSCIYIHAVYLVYLILWLLAHVECYSCNQEWQVKYKLAFHYAKNVAAWDSILAVRNGRLPTSWYDGNRLVFLCPAAVYPVVLPYVKHCVQHFRVAAISYCAAWMHTFWEQCIRVTVPLMHIAYKVYNRFPFVHE